MSHHETEHHEEPYHRLFAAVARLGEKLGEIEEYLLGRLDGRITYIERRLREMAVDQAAFDAALTEFLADLDAGIAAIQAKIDALEVPVDLSAELAALTDAKTKLDAAVVNATDGPPPAPTA